MKTCLQYDDTVSHHGSSVLQDPLLERHRINPVRSIENVDTFYARVQKASESTRENMNCERAFTMTIGRTLRQRSERRQEDRYVG